MEVQTGDLLAGKYRVERVLGRGGMGVVVAAVQQPVGRRVAVKVLLRKDDDARAVARFTREARAAAELGSAHVVHLFDFGTLDSGAPYLAMELLDGVDLRSALERDGPLAIETAAQIALDVCEALARAHARGIVHRDIKPANLFLVRDHGRASIKVLDFGVAKTNELGDEGAALTQSDALLGTPRYMAPEQILSASDADARSDVWSLGATLYELVSGVPAFADATVGKTVARVLKARPAPLPPSVPAPFAAVIARCLSRAPKDRYPDVGALATALAPFAPANMSERPATIARIL
ncbi:MAG: serine/threonine-protein kinase, partial [Polyangiales bacterium]